MAVRSQWPMTGYLPYQCPLSDARPFRSLRSGHAIFARSHTTKSSLKANEAHVDSSLLRCELVHGQTLWSDKDCPQVSTGDECLLPSDNRVRCADCGHAATLRDWCMAVHVWQRGGIVLSSQAGALHIILGLSLLRCVPMHPSSHQHRHLTTPRNSLTRSCPDLELSVCQQCSYHQGISNCDVNKEQVKTRHGCRCRQAGARGPHTSPSASRMVPRERSTARMLHSCCSV